jgi:hypothetical protein
MAHRGGAEPLRETPIDLAAPPKLIAERYFCGGLVAGCFGDAVLP